MLVKRQNKMIDNKIFNIILLITIFLEFFIPFVLKHFYDGYEAKTMVMSVLGGKNSPVKKVYNVWLIYLGLFFIFTAFIYYDSFKNISYITAIITLFSIISFGIGGGILSGIFSVSKLKSDMTKDMAIHGIGSAIGFMALLLFPLLNSIICFKKNNISFGIFSIISFIFGMIFFILFIMGDKETFKDSIISYEGIWERLTLFCIYLPFVYKAINTLLS